MQLLCVWFSESCASARDTCARIDEPSANVGYADALVGRVTDFAAFLAARHDPFEARGSPAMRSGDGAGS